MAARQDARDTARRLLSLQEEERQRIAADLHDTTAQHLAAAGLALMQVSAVAGDPGAWLRRPWTRSGPPWKRRSGKSAPCPSCSIRPVFALMALRPRCASSSAVSPDRNGYRGGGVGCQR